MEQSTSLSKAGEDDWRTRSCSGRYMGSTSLKWKENICKDYKIYRGWGMAHPEKICHTIENTKVCIPRNTPKCRMGAAAYL